MAVPAAWSSLHQARACNSRCVPSRQVQILSTTGRGHALTSLHQAHARNSSCFPSRQVQILSTPGRGHALTSLHQAHARNSRSSPSRQVQILSTDGRAHAQAAEDAPQLVGGSLRHGLLALLLLLLLLLLHGVLLLLERSCHQGRGDAAPEAVGVLEGRVPAAQRKFGRRDA